MLLLPSVFSGVGSGSMAKGLPRLLGLLPFCVLLGATDGQDRLFTAGHSFTPEDYDLVELVTIDATIVLDIRYATPHNFAGVRVYPSARCFLRRAAAERLAMVQRQLRTMGLGLKVFDGYRPFSVQEIFWRCFPQVGYVAKPVRDATGRPLAGSKHNRGAAVDLTLIDLKTGQELELPSDFDDLSPKAHRDYAVMTSSAARNCRLLEDVMCAHGFEPLPTEWWHFDLVGWHAFDLLDVSFDEIVVLPASLEF